MTRSWIVLVRRFVFAIWDFFRLFPTRRSGRLFMFCLSLLALSSVAVAAHPTKRLFHNEDCTNLFCFHQIPAGKAGELIDHYVDVMAQSGVTVFLCNTNARRTNYRSRVWESFWDGYDAAGPDDQPFLRQSREMTCRHTGSSSATCWPSTNRESTIRPGSSSDAGMMGFHRGLRCG